jgi:hypothetical protein
MTAPERFAESQILFPCTAGAVHTWPVAQVVALQDNGGKLRPSRQSCVTAAIRRHLAAFDVDDEREVALALRWQGAPACERLASFAEGIRARPSAAPRRPPGNLHRRSDAIHPKRTSHRSDEGHRSC